MAEEPDLFLFLGDAIYGDWDGEQVVPRGSAVRRGRQGANRNSAHSPRIVMIAKSGKYSAGYVNRTLRNIQMNFAIAF